MLEKTIPNEPVQDYYDASLSRHNGRSWSDLKVTQLPIGYTSQKLSYFQIDVANFEEKYKEWFKDKFLLNQF